LSGLAHLIQNRVKGEYLAGLWESDLIRGLLWRGAHTIGYKHPYVKRSTSYIAPSWSWASKVGQVFFGFHIIHDNKTGCCDPESYQTKVIKASVTRDGVDPMGRVTHGMLELAGPLRIAEWKMIDDPRYKVVNAPRRYFILDSSEPLDELPQLESSLKSDAVTGAKISPKGYIAFDLEDDHPSKLWCLLLIPKEGIALDRVENSNHYRRVGIFTLRDMDWFNNCEIQNVAIV